MALILPDQGETILLDYLVGADTPENLTLRLFQNDVTAGLTAAQVEALTEADFTEADFTGYAALTLSGGSWTTTAGDPSTATFVAQTFTSSADQTAQTIYGYYYTRSTGGELVAFEEIGPYVDEDNGDSLSITPRITLADTQD